MRSALKIAQPDLLELLSGNAGNSADRAEGRSCLPIGPGTLGQCDSSARAACCAFEFAVARRNWYGHRIGKEYRRWSCTLLNDLA
jgi:hypothetical protein